MDSFAPTHIPIGVVQDLDPPAGVEVGGLVIEHGSGTRTLGTADDPYWNGQAAERSPVAVPPPAAD